MTRSDAVTIRFAGPEDAEEIHRGLLALARHVGDVGKIRSTPDDLRLHGFGENRAFECLLAEVGGETAGLCLFFRSFSTWFGRPGLYVQDLVVHDAFRGRGVGERLMRRAAAIAKSRGWTYIRLAVDHENPAAMAFYQRLGFIHRYDDLIYGLYDNAFEALAQEQGETP